MGVQLWNLIGFTASLSLGKVRRLPGGSPKSSARYDLAVVVSRPVSIFLRVLTGFFIPFSADLNSGAGSRPALRRTNLLLHPRLPTLLRISQSVDRPHTPRHLLQTQAERSLRNRPLPIPQSNFAQSLRHRSRISNRLR